MWSEDSSEEDDVAEKLEREDDKREDEEEEKWSRELMKHLNIEENYRDGIEKGTSVHPDPGGESKRSTHYVILYLIAHLSKCISDFKLY